MANRIPFACSLWGYIYTHAFETCSRDRLRFAIELEDKTRPKYHRVKGEAVMEVKLDRDCKISDTAEIRSLLHYCLEYMHHTLGVYYLEPRGDVGVLASSKWHMTPQLIGKYDPSSASANCVDCILDCDAVFTTIPKSALTRKAQLRQNSVTTDVPTRPSRPPPPWKQSVVAVDIKVAWLASWILVFALLSPV